MSKCKKSYLQNLVQLMIKKIQKITKEEENPKLDKDLCTKT